MADFTGIGGHTTFDQRLHQLAALHLPGCPDPYTLLDQCGHCYQPPYYPSPQSALMNTLPYGTQEQYAYQHALRTWAEVASTPPVMYRPTYPEPPATVPPSQPDLPQREPQWLPTFDPVVTAATPSTPRQTYAQVAHSTSHGATPQYQVQLQVGSSFLELQGPQQHANQNRFNRGASASQPGPVRRLQQRRLSNRTTPRASPYQSVFNSPLPQVQEELPPYAESRSNPRDVDNFVLQTQFRGHRYSQLLSVQGSPPAPQSPGTLSVASSQWSRSTNRRRGDAMRVLDPEHPYPCLECRKTFAKVEGLRRHVSRTHGHVANRAHPCPEPGCPWAFVNPKDLRRHLGTHRSAEAGPPDRFACPYHPCTKSYTRNDNLQRHINNDHLEDSAYMSQPMSRNASSQTTNTSFSQPIYE